MSNILDSKFTYSVDDVNNSVKRTNVLLRAANAVRLSFRDIEQVMKEPSFTNIMWTLVQLSRTYNALNRLVRLTVIETNKAATLIRFVIPDVPIETSLSADIFSPYPLTVSVNAFRENLPMPLDGIDISNLPLDTIEALQALLEDDAEETVADAKEILVSRILHPADSTGFLESSIGWQREAFGTRIYANAFYSWWVEEGQRTFTGHHYLRGATDLARQRLPPRIRETLNQLIISET